MTVNVFKYSLIVLLLSACISGGTHGSIKTYEFGVSKYDLEKSVNKVLSEDTNIKTSNLKDYYNDGEKYVTLFIKKDTVSYKYIFRYLGGKEDWDNHKESEFFITYIYDGKGNGGSIGNGKFEKTPIEIQEKMVNLFETEFVAKVKEDLKDNKK